MWTYLAILFSFSLLVGVYVRKSVLLKRGAEIVPDENEEDSSEDFAKKRISAEDRQKVEDLCNKGKTMLKVGRDDDAVKCFVQALTIDVRHQETLHTLAMLYLQKQMFGAASALFKQLGEMTNDAVHYSHLGLSQYQQNNFSEALRAYQKSLELDDTRPQRFVSLSQVYRAMEKPFHAIVALNKAIDIDEENLDLLFLLIDLQIETKNTEGAELVIKNILLVDPENKEAKKMLRKIKAPLKEE